MCEAGDVPGHKHMGSHEDTNTFKSRERKKVHTFHLRVLINEGFLFSSFFPSSFISFSLSPAWRLNRVRRRADAEPSVAPPHAFRADTVIEAPSLLRRVLFMWKE